jgi:hypothetical protein
VINANLIDYNIKASVGELGQELKLSIRKLEPPTLGQDGCLLDRIRGVTEKESPANGFGGRQGFRGRQAGLSDGGTKKTPWD